MKNQDGGIACILNAYIAAHPGVKLAHHLPGFIDAYPNAKGRLGYLQNDVYDR